MISDTVYKSSDILFTHRYPVTFSERLNNFLTILIPTVRDRDWSVLEVTFTPGVKDYFESMFQTVRVLNMCPSTHYTKL